VVSACQRFPCMINRAVELVTEDTSLVDGNRNLADCISELRDRGVRRHESGIRMILNQGVLFQIDIRASLEGVQCPIGQADRYSRFSTF
ncbi:MAG: hypothetical protein ABEH64_12065, partial [Salinirussus sp.]